MYGRSGHPRAAAPAVRLAVPVLLGLAVSAWAHSVSVSRGTLWIESDRLRVELLIPADDLLHALRPRPDEQDRLSATEVAELVQRYETLVAEHFIIRDGAGERVAGRPVSAAHDLSGAAHFEYPLVRRARITYVLEYEMRERPRFLTLQQVFFGGGISHAAQLALEVRATPDGPAQTVVLTNRGNAETIEIDWADCPAPRISLPEHLRSVRARMCVGATGIDVEIDVPLGLAETWRTVPRTDPDFLTPQEQAGALPAMEDLLREACAVEIDGRPAQTEIVAVGWLGPGQQLIEPGRVSRPLSVWSARASARLRFSARRTPQRLDLTWTLFNNAVLEAHLTVTGDNSTTEHVLTPYAPKLSRPIAVGRP